VLSPKTDDDVSMGQMMEENVRIKRNKMYADKGGSAEIDWSLVNKIFEKTSREELAQKITDTLLQTNSRLNSALLTKYLNAESRENYIKSAVINLMSTPEYQMA